MNLRLVRYENGFRNAWDEFLSRSINGTWLHSRAFFDHNPKNANDDLSFMFFKGDALVAIIPGNVYLSEGKRVWQSSLRATYGGFVVNSEVGVQEGVAMVGLLKEEIEVLGIAEIIIRNPFRIFSRRLSDETDYAMWFHGFTIQHREIETAIELGDFPEVTKRYAGTTSRNIRRARKSTTIGLDDDYESYWRVLNRNLAEKHGIRPTHSYEEFLELLESVGHDKIKLFTARMNDRIIAGVVLFITNDMAIHAQYICSDSEFQDLRPINGVIDELARWGCENGYRYLNLGTSNFDKGRGINEGLFRFKEGFGGRSVLRETMHIEL